jgi:cysteine desulfurase
LYFDHAASAPLADEVRECMWECMSTFEGNASARHAHVARRRIEQASAHIAATVGASLESVFYTSGATEADNWAIQSGVQLRPQAREIITAVTEHAAVLESVKRMIPLGYRVRYVPVNRQGVVEAAALHSLISDETALVSLMLVNNETGAKQNIQALAAVCHAHGVPLHVDAAQAPGRVEIRFLEWGIDAMSVSAHKQHGPVGVGALLLRDPKRWSPIMMGGGQQRGLRSGTLPVHQIVGMGEAYRLALMDRTRDELHYERLWRHAVAQLSALKGVRINAKDADRSYHILNVTFASVDGEALHALLAPRLSVSAGSACHSESEEPSKVLRALGLSDPDIAATVRLSFGRQTSLAEIDAAVLVVAEALDQLQALAPVLP